jgi:voltage-gated potassium channel
MKHRLDGHRLLGGVPNVRWLVAVITIVVVVCAAIARVVASTDFRSFGASLWWAVQTVTSVGYGDIIPHTVAGRVIAAVLMIAAVAFVSIFTAAIAAAFISHQRRRLGKDPVLAALERLERRLEAIEQRLDSSGDS